MGTNNPGILAGIKAGREVVAPGDIAAMVDAAVTAAVDAALAGKADLLDGKLLESQIPDRLSDTEIATTAGNAAATAVTNALTARNLPAPAHASSVALGADTTAESQISGGAKHWELLPSAAPLAPATGVRLWVETIGGKNTLRVIFPTGTAITLATEL